MLILDFDQLKSSNMKGYSEHELALVQAKGFAKPEEFVKVDENVLIYCRKGKGTMMVNGETVDLLAGNLLIVPSSSILDEVHANADSQFWLLFISDRLLKMLIHTFMDIWNKAFYVQKVKVLHVSDNTRALLEKLAALIAGVLNTADQLYKEEIIRSFVRVILIWMCGTLAAAPNDRAGDLDSAALIFNRFIELLSKENRKRHTVRYFSAQLNITPKYLAAVCKDVSGKTAAEWIKSYVNDEIVYVLSTSDENMKSVAYRCGFPNPSAFGKYIRENFQMTPKEYREALRNNAKK